MAQATGYSFGGQVDIVRRPMRDGERGQALAFYGAMQRSARALAVVSLVLFLLNLTIQNGSFPVPELAFPVSLFAIIFGLMALAVAGMLLVTRKRISAALQDGTAYDVRGPAFQNRTAFRNMPGWSLGPATLQETPEVKKLLVSGAPATVTLVPDLKLALSVNGTLLKKLAPVMVSSDLERMARPEPGEGGAGPWMPAAPLVAGSPPAAVPMQGSIPVAMPVQGSAPWPQATQANAAAWPPAASAPAAQPGPYPIQPAAMVQGPGPSPPAAPVGQPVQPPPGTQPDRPQG